MILLDFEPESYKTPSQKYILQMLPLISVISHKLSKSFIFFGIQLLHKEILMYNLNEKPPNLGGFSFAYKFLILNKTM
ncbi:hypothetical protein COE30_26080 [Bacillus cereus]|nr:hypothetical protein COE30_26080 [Bacillus cereus]